MTDIMTAQELSAYLKITTTTIYKLAQQGDIPSFKIGSDWRFKKDLIDRWVENGAGHAPKKILVVDDEPAICDFFLRALDRKKYSVDVAHSGEQAVQSARKLVYDYIFLDLKMPGMDGVEAFGEIKKLGARTMVVIMTAYPDSEQLVQAMKLGPLTVVLKPFELADIQRTVESLVMTAGKA